MARNFEPNRPAKAKIAEMEQQIRDMIRQENALKSKIYRLETTITGTPVHQVGQRLRKHNLIAAEDDDEEYPARSLRNTRWQAQRMNNARSKQAMMSLFLVLLFVAFVFWFYQQLRSNGVI